MAECSGPYPKNIQHEDITKQDKQKIFAVLVILGWIAQFNHIHIPHTEVLIDGRWAFGFMGFALLRPWWVALWLGFLLSTPLGSNIPFGIGLVENLLYAIPCLLVIRLFHDQWQARWGTGWTYGLGWLGLVLVCYQIFITPAVWGVLALTNGTPLWASIVNGWITQPFLLESILVAIFSATAMVAALTHQQLRQHQRRLDHIYRVLLGIRNVNQLIVAENDPNRLIHRACENLTETMGYLNVWIALLDEQGQSVITTSASGFTDGFKILDRQLKAGQFPDCMKRTLESDTIIVVKDPITECMDCPLSSTYSNRAGLNRRLSYDGKIYGILSVSVPAAYACDKEEQALFDEVANDLAFALNKIDAATRLHQSQRHYREIYNGSRDGFVMVDPTGRILDANPAFCDMLGYSLDELRALPDFYAITPERWHDWEKKEIWNNRLLTEGHSGLYEKEYIHKNSAVFPVELWSHVALDNNGKIEYLWGTVRDITERKETEEKTNEARQQFQTLVTNIPGITYHCALDEDWSMLYMSDAVEILTGYPASDFIQNAVRTYESVIHRDDTQYVTHAVNSAVAAEQLWDIEYRVYHKDGGIRWVHEKGRSVPCDMGKVVYLAGVILDITEKKQAEEALRESEHRFRSFVENANDIVYAVSPEGLFTYVSPNWLNAMGEEAEEAIGQSYEQYVHPEDRHVCRAFLEKVLAGEKKDSVEYRAKHRDGSWRCHVSSGSPMRDADGNIVSYIGIARDVTDRKIMEEELTRSRQSLRTVVDIIPAYICAKNLEGRFLLVNQTLADFYGSTVADMTDALHADFCQDQVELQSMLAADQEVIQSGQSVLIPEETMVNPDGSISTLETHKIPFTLNDEPAVLIVSTDITERKQKEKRISLLGQMIDAAPASITIHNTEGRFLFANQVTCTLHGYENGEDFLSINLHDLDVPESQELFVERVRQIEEKGEARFEVSHHRKDGTTFPLEVLAKIIEWDNQPAILSIATDITERKQIEGIQTFLAQTSSGVGNQPFFHALAHYLAQSLGMDFVCIDRLEGDGLTAQTVAVWCDGHFEDNVSYALKDTPCDNVVGKEICCYPASVRQLFPHDKVLQDLNAESYVGTTLWSHTGQPIGLIAVISRQPLPNRKLAERTLQLVAARAAGELERLQAEENLRKSEKIYRELIETASDAIYLMSEEGKVIRTNTMATKMLGYSTTEIENTTIDQIDPNYSLETFLSFWSSMPEGQPQIFESTHRRKDGCRIPVEISGTKFRVNDHTFYFGIARDITERKQAEKTLRESEERFRSLLNDVTTVAVQGYAPDGTVQYWNEGSRILYGYTAEEAMGENLLDLIIPPGMRNEVTQALQWMSETGTPIPASELILMQKNGSRVPVYSSHCLLTKAGAPQELFCIDVDLREIKQAESERMRLSAAIEQTAEIILVTTPDGVIEYVNPSFERITGYSREEAIGQKPSLLKSGKQSDAFYATLWETITSGHVWKGQMINKRKDGSLYTEEATITPIHDRDGAIASYVSVKNDITERTALEAQFRQAQKMESVGRLAGGVAHDFNNMLSVILGHSDLILGELSGSSPLADDIEEIRKAALRSADLTRQLLAFARKQTIAPKIIDLNDTISSMLKMLGRLIGEDIDLLWHPSPPLKPIRIDPAQIDQLLANLVVNARDAIGHNVGKITIETKLAHFDKAYCGTHTGFTPGDFVMLAVSDDGSGMDEHTKENIFDPFFTTKGMGEGTGLGLATVYGIVKQNRGFINVYSEVGQGTTFRIYLPVHTTASAQAASEPTPARSLARGHETILLVEDEPAILSMAAAMLTKLGYNVLTASTPGKAMRMAEEHGGDIHLLITDVVMPEMNGRDLAKNLLSLYPTIKRLFMSGYTANVIAHHGVLDDGVNFIQKPFAQQDLSVKVREALEG